MGTADSEPPESFYLVRLYTYGPFVCLRLAFFGGTPGALRHQIVREMRERIAALRLETRARASAQLVPPSAGTTPAPVATLLSNKSYDVDARNSSLVVQYDKWLPIALLYDNLDVACMMRQLQEIASNMLPSDVNLNVNANLNANLNANKKLDGSENVQAAVPVIGVRFPEPQALMLFRHLHHFRCVFSHSSVGIDPQSAPLVMYAILPLACSLLISQRLRAGFHFAYNSPGFVNLLLELHMSQTKPERASSSSTSTTATASFTSTPPAQADAVCSVQCAIFAKSASEPQHMSSAPQLVIEYWIEPQIGYVLGVGADLLASGSSSSLEAAPASPRARACDSDWRGLTYWGLLSELYKGDYNLLVALQTLEWLRLQYSSQSRPATAPLSCVACAEFSHVLFTHCLRSLDSVVRINHCVKHVSVFARVLRGH